MLFQVWSPPYPLNQFVERFWYHSGYSPNHSKEKLLPDGAIEIIIDLQDEPKRIFDRNDFSRSETVQRGWISGQHREFIVFEPGRRSHMIGVRFRPGGAHPFFRFRMAEINGLVVQLDSIWGSSLERLRERLAEAAGAKNKFVVLHDFLLRRAQRELIQDPVLRLAVTRIASEPEAVAIRDVARQTGISGKHLIRKFDHLVGLKPKLLLRILRFQRVLALIEQGRPIRWSALAYDCGFSDQAHFNREFKLFSGMNPSRYVSEKGEYLNFIPIP